MNYKSGLRLYKDILSEHSDRRIPYSSLLQASEWQEKRATIIKRDQEKCQKCKSLPTEDIGGYDKNGEKTFLLYDSVIKGFVQTDSGSFVTTKKEVHLHVHHKFYIDGKLPWEYLDESLITLCNWCHWDLHQNEVVMVYSQTENGQLIPLKLTPCNRCNGAGWFQEYHHVANGICFRCNGAMYEERI
jgi:hypothetical protein